MKLTEMPDAERAQLRAFARKTTDARESRKAMALLALAEGRSRREVAEMLLVSERAITKWRGQYLSRAGEAD